MKFIVTGANGFLGKTFCEITQLKKPEIQIFSLSSKPKPKSFKDSITHIQCDINDYSVTHKQFKEISPDVVFHFAANPAIINSNSSIIDTNVVLTDKILKCSKNSNFVLASSASVYGQSTDEKDYFTEDSGTNPESIYALTKVMAEELVKFYHKTKYIHQYFIYRYVAHVGKNATHGVLLDIINKTKKASNFIEIFGDYPGTTKPFLLASQSMQITLNNTLNYLIEKQNKNICNISPNDSLSVDRLSDIVMQYLNKKLDKKWLGNDTLWQGDQKHLKVQSKFSDNLYCSSEAISIATQEILQDTL